MTTSPQEDGWEQVPARHTKTQQQNKLPPFNKKQPNNNRQRQRQRIPKQTTTQKPPPRPLNQQLLNKNSRSSSCDSASSSASSASDSLLPQPPPSHPLHTLIACPFMDCPPDVLPFIEATSLVDHLFELHRIRIENVQHMFTNLEKYLGYWGHRIEEEGVEKLLRKENVDGTTIYTIDPETSEEDRTLRERLRREKLEEVLKIQERERQVESHTPRKCLFCKNMCQNRASLFRHMFSEHSFNIGLPDNLVNVSEFLNLLEAKLNGLQCLYCEKTFTSPAVLRKHMRKKKHFQIGKKNRVYDRFYIVNYHLEPGKSWEEFAKAERYDSDDDRRDDSWNDWDETDPEPTMCLFDQDVFPSPADCCAHLRDAHDFDLHAIRKENSLDFYKTVALINFIRQKTSSNVCMGCDLRVERMDDLVHHMKENGCFAKVPKIGHPLYEDPANLFATYPDDPLLWGFSSLSADEDEDDESEEADEDVVNRDEEDDGEEEVGNETEGEEEIVEAEKAKENVAEIEE